MKACPTAFNLVAWKPELLAYDITSIVSALATGPDSEYFPEEEQFSFVQIEIGDVPE